MLIVDTFSTAHHVETSVETERCTLPIAQQHNTCGYQRVRSERYSLFFRILWTMFTGAKWKHTIKEILAFDNRLACFKYLVNYSRTMNNIPKKPDHIRKLPPDSFIFLCPRFNSVSWWDVCLAHITLTLWPTDKPPAYKAHPNKRVSMVVLLIRGVS